MKLFIPKSNPEHVRVSVRGILMNKGKLLLLKRSLSDKHLPGVWELPGGKLDEGQTLMQSLKREMKEETGLSVSVIDKPIVLFEKIKSGRYKGFCYIQIVYEVKINRGIIRKSEEHDDIQWFSRKEIGRLKIRPEMKKIIVQIYEKK